MHFDLGKFITVAEFITPLVLPAFGVPPAVTNLVIHGITVAQTIDARSQTGMSGAEKKAVAMDIVTTGLNAVNAAKPGTIDVPELTGAVSDGIDVTIKAIKAAKDIPVHAEDLTPAPVVHDDVHDDMA